MKKIIFILLVCCLSINIFAEYAVEECLPGWIIEPTTVRYIVYRVVIYYDYGVVRCEDDVFCLAWYEHDSTNGWRQQYNY